MADNSFYTYLLVASACFKTVRNTNEKPSSEAERLFCSIEERTFTFPVHLVSVWGVWQFFLGSLTLLLMSRPGASRLETPVPKDVAKVIRKLPGCDEYKNCIPCLIFQEQLNYTGISIWKIQKSVQRPKPHPNYLYNPLSCGVPIYKQTNMKQHPGLYCFLILNYVVFLYLQRDVNRK